MPRPQFSLKTLLWLMGLIAAFLGGMAVQHKLDEPSIIEVRECGQKAEGIVTSDGKTWIRYDADD